MGGGCSRVTISASGGGGCSRVTVTASGGGGRGGVAERQLLLVGGGGV